MRNYRKIEITDGKESNAQVVIQDNWLDYDLELIYLNLIASRLIETVDKVFIEVAKKKT